MKIRINEYNRVLVIILGLWFITAIILIGLCPVLFLHHECLHESEEECPVCECIRVCYMMIRQIGVQPLPMIALVIVNMLAKTGLVIMRKAVPQTPVARKVRLNN